MQSKQRASGRTVSAEQAVVLENIEHTTHLAENKYSRAFHLHRLEKLVKNNHFPAVVDKMCIGGVGWSRFLYRSVSSVDRGGKEIYILHHRRGTDGR